MKYAPMNLSIEYDNGAEDLIRQLRNPYTNSLDLDMHKRDGPNEWWRTISKPSSTIVFSTPEGGNWDFQSSIYGNSGVIITSRALTMTSAIIGELRPRSQIESQYETHAQHIMEHEERVRAMANRRESERRAIQSELDRRNAEAAKAKPKTPWAKFRQLF